MSCHLYHLVARFEQFLQPACLLLKSLRVTLKHAVYHCVVLIVLIIIVITFVDFLIRINVSSSSIQLLSTLKTSCSQHTSEADCPCYLPSSRVITYAFYNLENCHSLTKRVPKHL